jgi:hypothetical protein
MMQRIVLGNFQTQPAAPPFPSRAFTALASDLLVPDTCGFAESMDITCLSVVLQDVE